MYDARREGARAANKNVVDTGWHYEPNTASSNPKPVQEEDREPAPVRPSGPSTPPASQSELQQARAAAQGERPNLRNRWLKLFAIHNADDWKIV